MFPLHDRTRRLLCRAVFIAFGLLPALGVLAWSGSINSAAHQAAVCSRLQAEIGLDLRVDDVSYPRPHVMVLHDVELLDPRSQATLARCRLVEIQTSGSSTTVVAAQPEVDLTQFANLKRLISDRLQSSKSFGHAVQLSSSELTLRWTGDSRTVHHCQLEFKSEPESNRFQGTFAFDNSPVRWSVTHAKQADVRHTETTFETGESALPCSLLADLAGCENRLGTHSTFSGSISIVDLPDGKQAELNGEIRDIDLNEAVSRQFPHRLGGIATLRLQRAVVRRGRLEEAEGSLSAGPGVVGYSLLQAASQALQMQTIPRGPENILDYRELAASFELDAHGITLRGQCKGTAPNTFIRTESSPLLIGTTDGPMPIVAIVKALVPDSRIQVPATRQTDWLLQVLPVPDVLPSDPDAAPHARLRDSRPVY